MDRKQFEEWFKGTDGYKLLEEMNYFKIDLFIFKEHRSQYQHTTVQIAYMTWQHLQAKVVELQKRLDGALKETQYALQYVEGDMRGNHEFLQMAMIRTFKALEQVLNGGEPK